MIRAQLCITIIAVLLISVVTGAACLADATTDYSRGMELSQAGKYREAIPEFAKVPADSSLAPKAYYETARCYGAIMNLDDAIAACNKGLALASDAQDRELLNGQMKKLRFSPVGTLMKAGKWDDAISVLHGLAGDHPEDSGWQIAMCCIRKNDYQMALDTLTGLLGSYPHSQMCATYDSYRARCLFFLGRQDEASAHLLSVIGKVTSADPDAVETADVIAESMVKAGRTAEAKAFYNKLLEAAPAHPIAVAWKFRLANYLYRERDRAAARMAFDAICVQYPSGNWHIAAEYMAADCSEKLGNKEEAIRRFEVLATEHAGVNEAQNAPRRLAKLRAEAK